MSKRRESRRNGKADVEKMEMGISDVSNETPTSDQANSKKRENEDADSSPTKYQKIKHASSEPKNAIACLNELQRDVEYVFESGSGPSHNPTFECYVTINGEKFIGKGSSKKLAKHAAAESALKSFVQLRSTLDVSKCTSRVAVNVDFTADDLQVGNADFIGCQRHENVDESVILQTKIRNKLSKLSEATLKSPVVLLNELCPGLPYEVVKEDATSKEERFIMSVTVDKETFEGVGPNKKAAKAAAAQAVLSKKYKVNFDGSKTDSIEADVDVFDFPQEVADKIGKVVHDSINAANQAVKKCPKWEILTGVVMTKDEAMEDMKVVCFATGSKSLNGENMSLIGAVLTDCHAEVLARRCLRDYLFTQLECHAANKGEESIFEKVNEKFKLKPNYKFHLYCTTAPCGDASTAVITKDSNRQYANLQQLRGSGMLRTKLESGSGTVPVESAMSEQKMDDIMAKRARYQIMSCSDKLALWNVLGIQGCLLNYFIEPIYFHSMILGQQCQRSHMVYSMYKRIERSLVDLPSSFSLHKPKMAYTSFRGKKQPLEPQNISINWTYGLKHPELLAADTGKPIDGHVSRLAKRSFFQRFSKLHDSLLKKHNLPHFYDSVKKASPDYDKAKGSVLKAFVSSGCGIWKKKPKEQDAFELSF